MTASNVVHLPPRGPLIIAEERPGGRWAVFGVCFDGSRRLLGLGDMVECRSTIAHWQEQGCRLAVDSRVWRRIQAAA